MRPNVNEYMVPPFVFLGASVDIATVILKQLTPLCQLASISHEPLLIDCASWEARPVFVSFRHKVAQVDTKVCVQNRRIRASRTTIKN